MSHILSSCNPPIARKTFWVTFDYFFVEWAAHQTVLSVSCYSDSEILAALQTVFCFVCISLTADGPQRARLPIPPTVTSPSCLWSRRIFPSLPGSRLTIFNRDASSALLQLVNHRMVEFDLLTFSRFPSRKKENKNWFSQESNLRPPLIGVRGYLLNHSGNEGSRRSCSSYPKTSWRPYVSNVLG